MTSNQAAAVTMAVFPQSAMPLVRDLSVSGVLPGIQAEYQLDDGGSMVFFTDSVSVEKIKSAFLTLTQDDMPGGAHHIEPAGRGGA